MSYPAAILNLIEHFETTSCFFFSHLAIVYFVDKGFESAEISFVEVEDEP